MARSGTAVCRSWRMREMRVLMPLGAEESGVGREEEESYRIKDLRRGHGRDDENSDDVYGTRWAAVCRSWRT